MRPAQLQVFVSSQMRANALDDERAAAVKAIEDYRLMHAWHWERDAHAGPYCSEVVCVGAAEASDCLVLILGETLTDITRKEYDAAYGFGVPCFILIKEGVDRDQSSRDFIARERDKGAITLNFRNLSELQSCVTRSLDHFLAQAARRDNFRRRGERTRRRRLSRLPLGPGGGR